MAADMRSLARPAIDHKELYDECVAQTQSNVDRATLEGLSDPVVAAGAGFAVAAEAHEIHGVQPMAFVNGEGALVRSMYRMRLVDKDGRGRWAYDKIKNSARFCPYCSFGEIYEVDHFLSKTDYPELSICPSNLVPICHPCNHIKHDASPEAADRYLLHPYFDSLPNIRWLFSDLEYAANGPILRFRVELDLAEYGNLAGRLSYHFETLGLDRRFQERAAQILVEIENDLTDHFEGLGAEGLAAHFSSESNRHFRNHGNCLEAAAYLAASESAEFCAGRYRN